MILYANPINFSSWERRFGYTSLSYEIWCLLWKSWRKFWLLIFIFDFCIPYVWPICNHLKKKKRNEQYIVWFNHPISYMPKSKVIADVLSNIIKKSDLEQTIDRVGYICILL